MAKSRPEAATSVLDKPSHRGSHGCSRCTHRCGWAPQGGDNGSLSSSCQVRGSGQAGAVLQTLQTAQYRCARAETAQMLPFTLGHDGESLPCCLLCCSSAAALDALTTPDVISRLLITALQHAGLLQELLFKEDPQDYSPLACALPALWHVPGTCISPPNATEWQWLRICPAAGGEQSRQQPKGESQASLLLLLLLGPL